MPVSACRSQAETPLAAGADVLAEDCGSLARATRALVLVHLESAFVAGEGFSMIVAK